MFSKYTERLSMVANIFQIMYGINHLDLVSLYKNNELIRTTRVSTKAINGLFTIKNKKVNTWLEK